MANSPHKETILIASPPDIDESAARAVLSGKYSAREIEQLNLAYLADIVVQFNRLTRTRSVIFFSHPSVQDVLENYFLTSMEYRRVEPDVRGSLIAAAIDWGFREERCRQLFLLLAPHPLVCASIIDHSLRLLTIDDDSVVYGALSDGVPYLLGMKAPHQEFASLADCDFSNTGKLLRQCCAIEGGVHSLPTLPVIRSFADLSAMKTKLEQMYEIHCDYPKKSLACLRQLDESHGVMIR